MEVKVKILYNEFHDSILLMKVSEKIRDLEGIIDAAALMATEGNKEILKNIGLYIDEIDKADASDLIIVVKAKDELYADKAISEAISLLSKGAEYLEAEERYYTLDDAFQALRNANLCFISIPGEYAAIEAEKALELGLHVHIFSSNVPIEDEVRLKDIGRRKGLLVMGPDAGTSIIGGVGLGFANKIKRGDIGIVAASGTGLQEVSSIISRYGGGISQAIGVGSRDLSDEVGGITTLMAINYFKDDPETRVILLVSKPPSPIIAKKILEELGNCGKKVVVYFIGLREKLNANDNIFFASTLEDAAFKALYHSTGFHYSEAPFTIDKDVLHKLVEKEIDRLDKDQRFVRGLFTGGTFATESQLILGDLLNDDIYSNTPIYKSRYIHGMESKENTIIDMGAEEFVEGRPHPMIDPRLRNMRIIKEMYETNVAVILLDIVLGYGSHNDPAGEVSKSVIKARQNSDKYVSVVCSVTGTYEDIQNYREQVDKLESAGIIVMPSNAQATRLAALIATRWDASKFLWR
jgi:FdrA protein